MENIIQISKERFRHLSTNYRKRHLGSGEGGFSIELTDGRIISQVYDGTTCTYTLLRP